MRLQKAKNQKRGPGKAADRKAALSAQQTIPYLVMHPDGVCQLPGGLYTKTVEYEDINYSVASTEDQTAIFGGWSSFLNYFDTSLPFQLSFINRRSRSRNKYRVNIPQVQDDFNSVRAEFTGMLKNQIARSNNGIERSKYITFGLPADGIGEARPRTASTFGSPACSEWASIGGRLPICRSWLRSSPTSSWRKSWSWTRS